MGARFTAFGLAVLLVIAGCGSPEEAAPAPDEVPTEDLVVEKTEEIPVEETTEEAPQFQSGSFAATVLGSENKIGVTSGRFQAMITVAPGPDAEFDTEITIHIAGAFNNETGDSELTMDWGDFVTAAMQSEDDAIPAEFAELFTEPMQIKVIGDKSYMKWAFFSIFFGTDKWIEGDADQSATMTEGFGFGTDGGSPTELLDALAEANAEVEFIGNEIVMDVATKHYRALLDIATLSAGLTEEEIEELEDDLGELGLSEFPIDVWVGEDGNVYRYSITVDAGVAGADTQGFESMTMVFEMWDFGADIVIEPPPANEIATEDELGFGFDFEG